MSQVSDFPQLSQFCYVPELFRRFSGYLSIFWGAAGWRGDHNRPKCVYFFCLLDMFGFAPKCMGEGGGKVTQTIPGRKYSGT